jgi:hypothetical protein
VPAFDDGSCPIIFPDAVVKFREITSIAFGDHDVGGASQVRGRLTKGASGKEIIVTEGGLPVDQDQIEAALQAEVLEPVIED